MRSVQIIRLSHIPFTRRFVDDISLGVISVSRSFGLVDYKVQEAEYFLLQITGASGKMNFHGVQFCTSAFVSAIRSVTFAMQASLKGVPRFDGWYEQRQSELRADPLAKFFHDFRTVTNHIGANLVGAGTYGKDGAHYFFMPSPDLKVVPEKDVTLACVAHFKSILALVYDCYVEFGTVVNGQHYFTESNFRSLGKSIEDAEEELGFPRGWTHLEMPDANSWRWQTIRKLAGGCLIEEQFETWLHRAIPHPDRQGVAL